MTNDNFDNLFDTNSDIPLLWYQITFGCGKPAIEQAIRNFVPSFIVQFTKGSKNVGDPFISSSEMKIDVL